jgi:hypothetical protein
VRQITRDRQFFVTAREPDMPLGRTRMDSARTALSSVTTYGRSYWLSEVF